MDAKINTFYKINNHNNIHNTSTIVFALVCIYYIMDYIYHHMQLPKLGGLVKELAALWASRRDITGHC